MARTDSAAVTALLVDVESGVSLTQFITVANLIVTKHCTDADFTTNELEVIERYVAAHLYTVSLPRTTQEKAGSVSISYQHAEDLGFNGSSYGQMAMRLDWSGALVALDNVSKKGLRRSVDLTWLGIEND